MGVITKLSLLTVLVAVGALLYPLLYTTKREVPTIEDKWFGKAVKGKDIETITKFFINVSDHVLNDLRRRLDNARYVEPLDGVNFNYGFNSDYLKKVIEHWKTKFDWRKQELILNKYNHYKTQISGIDVHFIHVKPSKPAKTVLPQMLIHGWPGSVFEYYKTIPLLTEPQNDVAFELIIPSIPGFGFSEAPKQPGFDMLQSAMIFVKLIKRLGHTQFFVHGEDWGSLIAKRMAIIYPENVRGLHITLNSNPIDMISVLKLFIGSYFPSLIFDDPEYEYKKLYPMWNSFKWVLRETGYYHIQSTKPDTIGAALIDSPVGLAAYIMEKWSTWTKDEWTDRPDGGLTEKYTLDELLTNVMIYWTSENLASSLRFYKENFPESLGVGDKSPTLPVLVPSAVADFPEDRLGRSSQTLAKRVQFENLIQFTDMPRGGHFAAFEEPILLVNDIRSFVEKVLELEM